VTLPWALSAQRTRAQGVVNTPKASASISAGSEGPLSDNGASGERDESIMLRRKLEQLFMAIGRSCEILIEPKFDLDALEYRKASGIFDVLLYVASTRDKRLRPSVGTVTST